ncbi:MAG: DegT/DnrJ/EryC1/StrS family aminotransferase, partial [Pseudomonadota bacterium]
LETYHVSLDSLKRMASDKTKALVYTHLFGNMTDCSEILEFCSQNGIAFVEDAAQSFGSRLNGLQAGALGDCSSFSFNSNKVVAGINGGGVFMTDDEELARKARLYRRHGKDKDFSLLGYNSKMYTLNAQIISYRLKRAEVYRERRQKIAETYYNTLQDLPVTFQKCPQGLVNNFHKFTIRLESKDTRKRVKNALSGSIHYERPLSTNSMYQGIAHRKDDCVNAKTVADTIVSLPVHAWLTNDEVKQVCELVREGLNR